MLAISGCKQEEQADGYEPPFSNESGRPPVLSEAEFAERERKNQRLVEILEKLVQGGATEEQIREVMGQPTQQHEDRRDGSTILEYRFTASKNLDRRMTLVGVGVRVRNGVAIQILRRSGSAI